MYSKPYSSTIICFFVASLVLSNCHSNRIRPSHHLPRLLSNALSSFQGLVQGEKVVAEFEEGAGLDTVAISRRRSVTLRVANV